MRLAVSEHAVEIHWFPVGIGGGSEILEVRDGQHVLCRAGETVDATMVLGVDESLIWPAELGRPASDRGLAVLTLAVPVLLDNSTSGRMTQMSHRPAIQWRRQVKLHVQATECTQRGPWYMLSSLQSSWTLLIRSSSY